MTQKLNYGDVNYFNGLLLIEDHFMLEYIDNIDFTWIDAIFSWNPCTDFGRPRMIQVPSALTISDGRYIIGHPETLRRLKQRLRYEKEWTNTATSYTEITNEKDI